MTSFMLAMQCGAKVNRQGNRDRVKVTNFLWVSSKLAFYIDKLREHLFQASRDKMVECRIGLELSHSLIRSCSHS